MSVTSIGRPDPDEPAVRHPGLRAMVDAARAQPSVAVTLDADRLHAAWQQQRARRRQGLLVVAAAAVVALGLASLAPRLWSSNEATSGEATIAANAWGDEGESSPSPSSESSVAPGRLAEGIEVRALDGGERRPTVLDPHRLALPDGRWSIDSHAEATVTLELPDGVIALRGGHVHVEVAGASSRMDVVREEVTRIARAEPSPAVDGRSPAAPDPSSTIDDATIDDDETTIGSGPARPEAPSADELARQAEEQMAAGHRAKAIQTLRRLVTLHPRSATAQAGLIDLGRLLEASGRADEARCAYATFLERWPGHALGGDVQRAHRALGEGPACRGLRPRTSG